MARNKLINNLTLTIAILGFIISLIVMLFGDNLLDRSKGTDLNIITSKNEFQLPDKLKNIITSNLDPREEQLIPDTIRIVTLRNEGTTSRNLKVILNMDGPIYQNKITSTEDVSHQIVDESSIRVTMERLSKHAEISMVFWVRNENIAFEANYSDDIKSGYININSVVNEEQSKLNNIFLLIALISLSGVFYEVIRRLIVKFKNASLDNNKDLFDEVIETYLKINRRESINETNKDENEDAVEVDPTERLKMMMEQLKNAKQLE